MGDEDLQRLARAAIAEPSTENLVALGAAYLRHLNPGPTILTIIGRYWFSKGKGHSYHRVDVYLDGDYIGSSDINYGRGYIQTGIALAIAEGALPEKNPEEASYQWEKRIGIKIVAELTRVRRRADL